MPAKDQRKGTRNRSTESERRRQLVKIAFEQIANKGFEGLRFQQVAKAAGINNATLYYYFPSKEALIQGVVAFLMDRLKEPGSGPTPPAESAVEELRRMFEGVSRRVTEDPEFFVVITELALRAKRDPAIDAIGKQRDGFWERRLRDILERGMAESAFRPDLDLEVTVASLMAQIKGIAHHAAMGERKPGEVNAVVAEIARQVEHWLTRGAPGRTGETQPGTSGL